ncbi:MAG: M16 family metallopeptidase [Prolixibacteraceae bacterium]
MKYILIMFLMLITGLLPAQQGYNLTDTIPEDPKVSKGVLENGLTYYVRANENPKNRAELMLVVKAGSVDEDEDQLGLAHFAEHMAFNGTKNFPKNELVDYFESIGMEFGPEINAYTNFDETVYMLKVPLDSAEYLEKGLQVLYDWAGQVTDSDEEIEAERGVIYEEWRGGRGANQRMMQEWLPVFLHDSRYAERLPIGEMDIIQNAPPEDLRRYREDWYRPDLQAIIVVGDFDQEKMVEKVKDKFAALPAAEDPREKKYFDIPYHEETLVSIVTDEEAQYSVAQVYYKHPLEKSEILADYRKTIIQGLYNGMINNRLSELTQQADPPFIFGQSSFSQLFGPTSVYQSIAVTQNNQIQKGLEAVLMENQRLKEFGFTQSELNRQKTSMLNAIEKAYNERENQKSITYAQEYKRNFLITEEPFPGIEKEYEYFKSFIPEIKLEEVNELTEKWIRDENRVVVITAPEKEGVETPEKQEVFDLLEKVEEAEVEPYEDAVADIPLISEEPVGSKVAKVEQLEKVDAEEWTLENGATVVLKTTDFKDDEILFSAWSPGGNSLYGIEDDVSASLAATIMGMSGIAGFDNIMLDKLLSDKVFSINPYINELREGFNGSSSVKDVETLLQMVYLYFTEPRFDEISFQSYMARMEGMLENKAASPESAFQDTISVVMADYHERARPMTKEVLQEADFNRIKEIGKERFKNASDFKFFFVGNIDKDEFKLLVEKYLGGIPSVDENEQWNDLNIEEPEGVVEKVVKKGKEDKSLQYIVFHGDFDYNTENRLVLDAVERILSTRLLEVIREDKSSVYSIRANASSSKYPDPEYSVSIYYGTDPAKIEELQQAVFEEIKDFAENGPSDDELAKAKEKMLRQREIARRENNYWLSVLSNTYYLKNGDFSEYGTFEEKVDDISQKDVIQAFNDYFNFDQYVSVALKPAE